MAGFFVAKMRIVVKRIDPPLPCKDGPNYPLINGVLPSFEDARFYSDDGTELTDVTSCTIEITPNEVITAYVSHLVTELDIECTEDPPKP